MHHALREEEQQTHTHTHTVLDLLGAFLLQRVNFELAVLVPSEWVESRRLQRAQRSHRPVVAHGQLSEWIALRPGRPRSPPRWADLGTWSVVTG